MAHLTEVTQNLLTRLLRSTAVPHTSPHPEINRWIDLEDTRQTTENLDTHQTTENLDTTQIEIVLDTRRTTTRSRPTPTTHHTASLRMATGEASVDKIVLLLQTDYLGKIVSLLQTGYPDKIV